MPFAFSERWELSSHPRRRKSLLIIPDSRLSRNGRRYNVQAVVTLSAWTVWVHITEGHRSNEGSSEVAAWAEAMSRAMVAPMTLEYGLAFGDMGRAYTNVPEPACKIDYRDQSAVQICVQSVDNH